ncbi:hypothetical protein NSK_007534 [Nannochloropsis salina CCMP1776]|uniref:Uncharacterized protein n=1 Tax=Nannochloropsis salina CCMP1776 TaxID=1027361 RepID=A0A4D9CUD0_9STRA|nr:hypothetical protein NSK_007534 [Nannochloropsis salina CCMP1776]|eukprot:TFJ81145.1 hypothetical protein NSK_007534 [Nannochloropsis salina CCMP1776]
MATVNVQLGFSDDKAHIHGDLSSGYEETGYACMDQDRWRNAYFEAAIAEASAAKKKSAEGLEVEEKGSMRPPCQASNNGPGPLHGHRHWLEIGPGAMGTLSRLVLEAHPDNTLIAIEAVPSSARAVVKRLQRWYGREKRRREGGRGPGGGAGRAWGGGGGRGAGSGKRQGRKRKSIEGEDGKGSKAVGRDTSGGQVRREAAGGDVAEGGKEGECARFRVVQGLAGHVALPFLAALPSQQHPTALVAEVLGHFGSSEGYVSILHQCARAYPSLPPSLTTALPLIFGTKYVPVDLTSPLLSHPLRIAAVGKRLVLFQRFPFRDTQLSPAHGTMEEYNALEELRRPPTADLSPSFPPSPRIFPAHWRVEEIPDGRKARAFHGLAFYLFFGQGGGRGREGGRGGKTSGRAGKGGREEGREGGRVGKLQRGHRLGVLELDERLCSGRGGKVGGGGRGEDRDREPLLRRGSPALV